MGHTVNRVRAALAPIYLTSVTPEHSGVSLRNVVLRARQGKQFAQWRGDLLFTHQGISGPTALGISRLVAERMESAGVTVEVDTLPDESEEDVAARLIKFVSENPAKRVSSFTQNIPDRLVSALFQFAGIAPDVSGSRLDKKGRNRLIGALKGWSLGAVRHVPLEKGEVVAGGVDLNEIDPHSMASKRVIGLFLCGEILDVAGPVGGYNLQAAFSTGFVAGETAVASDAKE